MSGPLWIGEVSERFWAAAGGPEPFPRTLRRGIARAVPVSVVSMARLHVAQVNRWFERYADTCPLAVADRPLRACLVARHGHGLVFIDGADPDDEQRFSLAHELAHFLCDYWQPRGRAAASLGPRIAPVFDGERAATAEERIRALIGRVELQPRFHLMERTADGHRADAHIDEAERAADRLAFELLAPEEIVLAAAGAEAGRGRLAELLGSRFGLPARAAAEYARLLAPTPPRHSQLLRGLFPGS